MRALAATVADLLFPPRCPACRTLFAVSQAGRGPLGLCETCEDACVTAEVACGRCGQPGPERDGCFRCTPAPPAYDTALAAFLHVGAPVELLHRFKYGDRPELAGRLADALKPLEFPAIDVIAPVPLHASRRRGRSYDQAALLARALASRRDTPVDTTLLTRVRATTPQVGQDRTARAKNVAAAFVAAPRVKDRRVLLVDDVVTTGATASAAARALKDAGAAFVVVVSVTRAA